MGEWQPIETAPKDGSEIIIFVDDEQLVTCAYWCRWTDDQSHGFWEGIGGNQYFTGDVTHWMPLPAPPLSPKQVQHD